MKIFIISKSIPCNKAVKVHGYFGGLLGGIYDSRKMTYTPEALEKYLIDEEKILPFAFTSQENAQMHIQDNSLHVITDELYRSGAIQQKPVVFEVEIDDESLESCLLPSGMSSDKEHCYELARVDINNGTLVRSYFNDHVYEHNKPVSDVSTKPGSCCLS
ncbi:hypothetical protein [Legionella spiritensis]|uniref:hypothetical protein n=1 Tax=Legionella spiritensis TaxID=452 RepID=UPI000F709452|nr:hypothetical protein [Legionella spiritensis]VEG90434.1 Uncharacterised protein [Legionella spiritensis]